MPPDLDIYILTRQLDLNAINQFIDEYVDRAASEDRGDEELMLVSSILDSNTMDEKEVEEWIPALTLSHSIQIGLSLSFDHPGRAFTIYLQTQSQYAEIIGALICFTSDQQLIFGLAIDDEGAKPENLSAAKVLLERLATAYKGHLGLIAVHQPPPQNEEGFKRASQYKFTLFHTGFDKSFDINNPFPT
jgi:hypothetical protein